MMEVRLELIERFWQHSSGDQSSLSVARKLDLLEITS